MTERTLRAGATRRSASKRNAKTRKATVRWTKARTTLFLEALAATSNVSEAARRAGMTTATVYDRKQRDPEFAVAWRAALDIGFAELEMLMLRLSLHGSERTETVKDVSTGAIKQVKTVHSYPLATASRLLSAHREEVERYRLFEAARCGGDPTIVDRVSAEMARVRARLGLAGATDGEDGDGCEGPDDDG